MQTVLQDKRRQQEFKHNKGELSQVYTECDEIGMRKIRIANLPPEVPDRTIMDSSINFSDVKKK